MASIQIISPDEPKKNISDFVEGELIVTFKPGQDAKEFLSRIEAIADKYEIEPYRQFTSINACAYKLPSGKREELVERLIEMLKQEKGILNVERSGYFGMMGRVMGKE